MCDLTTADGFELIRATHNTQNDRDVTDLVEIDRWSKYGNDRLYLNNLDTGDGYLDLQTGETGSKRWTKVDARYSVDGDELTIEVYKGTTVYYTLVVRVRGDGFEPAVKPRDVEFEASESAVTPADGDHSLTATEGSADTELVTDGGRERGLSADEWDRIQTALSRDLEAIVSAYRDDENDNDVVVEDSEYVVLSDATGHELAEIADRNDVDRAALSERMHAEARRLTDYNWGYADPVVIHKSESVREGERHVLREIARRTAETGSVARAVDTLATEVYGRSQAEWSRETDRNQSTVSRTTN